jgi:hypothetical protein
MDLIKRDFKWNNPAEVDLKELEVSMSIMKKWLRKKNKMIKLL